MSESAQQRGERLSSWMQGKQKFIKKKRSQDGRRLFRIRIFSLQTYYFPSASCKMFLLCCYNTAAEALPKLCHVVREGERKQPLFPLSKMAEGRGKAAMSREEEWCSPSCSGEGWAIQRASLPRFPLLTHALCPISRLSYRTNGVQLCCQSMRNSTWPTMQGKAPTVNEYGWYGLFPHAHIPMLHTIVVCHPPDVLRSF